MRFSHSAFVVLLALTVSVESSHALPRKPWWATTYGQAKHAEMLAYQAAASAAAAATAAANAAAAANTTSGSTSSVGGVIINSSNASTITKTGSGSLILNNTNTYSGTTTIASGTVILSGGTTTTGGTTGSGGTTQSGGTTISGGFTLSGGTTVAGGTTTTAGLMTIGTLSGGLTLSGATSLSGAANAILTFNQIGATTATQGSVNLGTLTQGLTLSRLGTGSLNILNTGITYNAAAGSVTFANTLISAASLQAAGGAFSALFGNGATSFSGTLTLDPSFLTSNTLNLLAPLSGTLTTGTASIPVTLSGLTNGVFTLSNGSASITIGTAYTAATTSL